MKVSIIIPVYNVEKYLKKCIESIIKQTYENIEIILVNDGSNDCSGEICNEFTLIDSRIKVLHKKNGGVSSARNAGLEIATGDYIGFIDSDDWIEEDMYEILIGLIKKYNSEIAVCGFVNNNYVINEYKNKQEKVLSVENCLTSLLQFDPIIGESLCNKLFSRKFFEGSKIRLNEKVTIGEDLLCCCQCVLNAKSIAVTLNKKYHYRQTENSAMSKKFQPTDMSVIDAHEQIIQAIKKRYPKIVPIVKKRLISSCVWLLIKMEGLSNNEMDNINKLKSLIRKGLLNYLFSSYENIKMKSYALLIAIDPRIFYILREYLIKLLKK